MNAPLARAEFGAPTKASPWKSKQVGRIKLYLAMLTIDVVSIWLGFGLAADYRAGKFLGDTGFESAAVCTFFYCTFAVFGQVYTIENLRNQGRGVGIALRTLLLALASILVAAFALKSSEDLSRAITAVGILSAGVLLVGGRLAVLPAVRRSIGATLYDEVAIIDNYSAEIPRGVKRLDARLHGFKPNIDDPSMLDRVSRNLQYADRVIICCTHEREAEWAQFMKGLDVRTEICVDRPELNIASGIGRFNGAPTLIVNGGPLSIPNQLLKRALDLAVTIPLIVFIAPALIAIALAIKLDSKGPIFFVQDRMGYGNRMFKMYKFRSMHVEQCDAQGDRSASRDDHRVTRFGRLMRRTSVDELPQLLNVLKGDMSLVGPRPHALGSRAENLHFWKVDRRYWHRHMLKPGITGLAQVRGFRGATERKIDLEERLRCDLEYVTNWSLGRDMAILAQTIGVLFHKNAF